MSAMLPGGLFALSAALAATLVYQAVAPVPAIDTASATAQLRAVPVAPLPDYTPPPADQFAILNQRPAFSPTREPIAEPEEEGAPSQTPPDVSLVGVAIGLNKSVALLKTPDDPAAISAVVGQSIGSWRIVRIDADRVVFHANATDYTVKIRAAAGTTPAPPPQQKQ